MRHLLFIPVYNCEVQIIRVIDKIFKSVIYEKFEEIIIIDNKGRNKRKTIADKFG